MSRPLFSFLLVTHNQEAFVREAVEGAFAQTYSPLEIIISDDCSNDRTFDITREIVGAYRGPHSVRCRRNNKNLGLGGNISQAMDLCRGELILVAAGDDVSLPDRTEVTYEVWEESQRRATSVFSSYILMGKNGMVGPVGGRRDIPIGALHRQLEVTMVDFLSNLTPIVNGCTHAWSPSLFRFFGPLQSDREDLVLSFRTLAIGEMHYIDRPLVKYRRHGGNISFLGDLDDTQSVEERERRLRSLDKQSSQSLQNVIDDIEIFYQKGGIRLGDHDLLIKRVQTFKDYYDFELSLLRAGFLQRMGIFFAGFCSGNARLALRFFPRLLPSQIYRFLYSIKMRLTHRDAAWFEKKLGG